MKKVWLFRVYLVLAMLVVPSVRLAAPVWLRESPEVLAARDQDYMDDVETRLVYIAAGMRDTNTWLEYAVVSPWLIDDPTWRAVLLHTARTVLSADEYLQVITPPAARQEFHQDVLRVSQQCADYSENILEAFFVYYPDNDIDNFVGSLNDAVAARLSCTRLFNRFADRYRLFETAEGGPQA